MLVAALIVLAVEKANTPALAFKTRTCKAELPVQLPLVSLDDLAIFHAIANEIPPLPMFDNVIQPLGTVAAVVLFRVATIRIRSPL